MSGFTTPARAASAGANASTKTAHGNALRMETSREPAYESHERVVRVGDDDGAEAAPETSADGRGAGRRGDDGPRLGRGRARDARELARQHDRRGLGRRFTRERGGVQARARTALRAAAAVGGAPAIRQVVPRVGRN